MQAAQGAHIAAVLQYNAGVQRSITCCQRKQGRCMTEHFTTFQ